MNDDHGETLAMAVAGLVCPCDVECEGVCKYAAPLLTVSEVRTAAQIRAFDGGGPPPPYELSLDPDNFGPTVVLRGPAWCSRAAYEAFTDAGGAVETRGFALELRS